jgi:putative endonuclease
VFLVRRLPEAAVTRVSLGRESEAYAADCLQRAGLQILARNRRYGALEIDVLARLDALLIVVEVRFRRPGAMVSPLASITKGKQQRLVRAAEFALREFSWAERVRIDVAVVDGIPGALGFAWYPGAVTAESLSV